MTQHRDAPYSVDDFSRVAKFDAHVHLNVPHPALVEQAGDDGFEMLSINVDHPDFPGIAEQRATVVEMAEAHPGRVRWATTFSMDGFAQPGWGARIAAELEEAQRAGAQAVKIWKNIGMNATDADGRLVTLAHPALRAVAEQVQALGMVLIGHQGEPHNCWLPLEQMTTDDDRRYFGRRPEGHMYLRPDLPTHDALLSDRDRFLAAQPELRFVGAHLGSVEHDPERLAAFLDRFPNVVVDLAARMSHLQHLSIQDHDRMRAFFIRYQDRLLYGSDLTFGPRSDPERFRRIAQVIWMSHWSYLATSEIQHVRALDTEVVGLALPRDVVDKVYRGNALRVFGMVQRDVPEAVLI